MGRCSAMAVAAARMAITDAKLGANEIVGPRTAVVVGTTMGERKFLADCNTNGLSTAFRRTPLVIPKYGSTLLPIHVARAIGAQAWSWRYQRPVPRATMPMGSPQTSYVRAEPTLSSQERAEVIQELQSAGSCGSPPWLPSDANHSISIDKGFCSAREPGCLSSKVKLTQRDAARN